MVDIQGKESSLRVARISRALTRKETSVYLSLTPEERMALLAMSAGLDSFVSSIISATLGVDVDEPAEAVTRLDTDFASLELLCTGCMGEPKPVRTWFVSSVRVGMLQFNAQCSHVDCSERHMLIDLDRHRMVDDDVRAVEFVLRWGNLFADADSWPVRLGEVDAGNVRYTSLLPMTPDEVANRIGQSFDRHLRRCMSSLRDVRQKAKR